MLEQSHENWECIIVDDGSTDLSKEIIDPFLNKDSRFLFYQRQGDVSGAPVCRNFGLNRSRGEYVVFLDSDGVLLAHCVCQRVDYARWFPELYKKWLRI